MYEVLSPGIVKPCDVTIAYEEVLNKNQLDELKEFLAKRLPEVTGEGTNTKSQWYRSFRYKCKEFFSGHG